MVVNSASLNIFLISIASNSLQALASSCKRREQKAKGIGKDYQKDLNELLQFYFS